jgi:hypothetical protein
MAASLGYKAFGFAADPAAHNDFFCFICLTISVFLQIFLPT